MDNVSSLESLKFDSQSEVLYKDGGEKDLFSPAMVPINYDTPIIGSKADESEPEEPEEKELISDKSEAEELIGREVDESEVDESKADEWDTDESEADKWDTDESEADESDIEKYIGHECGYCLKVGDHFTQTCPYTCHVPKNAIVSKRCVVLCHCCGCHFRDSCCSRCGGNNGFAVIMNCLHCRNYGKHMTYMCPNHERSPNLNLL